MSVREIKRNIYSVGAIDWDIRLFDSLIPLPDGTSYNSYLIKGSEKTALIDTVDPTMEDILINHLNQLGVENLLMIPEEKFITVDDKEIISLGDRTLEFIHAPWVHWPETMLTYLKEESLLFSCDFFGSHIATTDLYVTDEGQVYEAAKRYFAEIMMPFRASIEKDLEKIKDYQIDIIAPSHGPMYDKPSFILDAYRSWVLDEPKNIVVLPYISMHGSTHKMVGYLVDALTKRGVTVKQFELTATDIGKLAIALVDAATIIIGTPTVLAGPHPIVANAAFLANALKPKLKFISIIGSYGWGGKTVEQLANMIPNLKAELLEPVLSKGFPQEADFIALDKLADSIAEKHKEHNLAS